MTLETQRCMFYFHDHFSSRLELSGLLSCKTTNAGLLDRVNVEGWKITMTLTTSLSKS